MTQGHDHGHPDRVRGRRSAMRNPPTSIPYVPQQVEVKRRQQGGDQHGHDAFTAGRKARKASGRR